MRRFFSLSALLALTIALAPHATWAGRASSGTNTAAASTAMVNGSVKITGLVFKQNESSDMRFNLQVLGSQGSGFVLFGQTDARYMGGGTDGKDNVDVGLDNLSFIKVGPVSSKGDLTADANSKLYNREGDNYGRISIRGRSLGTRAVEGAVAGIPVQGNTSQVKHNSFTSSGNAIVFDRLSVNGVASKGMMAYYYGGYNSYYAEDGLRFGKYEIHAINGKDSDTPIMDYNTKTQLMGMRFKFGNLIVNGTIQFNDSDQIRYRDVLVSKPSRSSELFNQGLMIQAFSSRNSFSRSYGNTLQTMGMIGMMTEGSTRTEVETRRERVIFATEGNYDLLVTRSGAPIVIDTDVDKTSADEADIRALIAFLELTVYDSFSE